MVTSFHVYYTVNIYQLIIVCALPLCYELYKPKVVDVCKDSFMIKANALTFLLLYRMLFISLDHMTISGYLIESMSRR